MGKLRTAVLGNLGVLGLDRVRPVVIMARSVLQLKDKVKWGNQ